MSEETPKVPSKNTSKTTLKKIAGGAAKATAKTTAEKPTPKTPPSDETSPVKNSNDSDTLSEQQTLGAMLTDRDILAFCSRHLQRTDFQIGRHQYIFLTLNKLFQLGESTDLITIGEHLRRKEQLESIGGYAYLVALIESVDTSFQIEPTVRKLIERAVIQASNEAIHNLSEEQTKTNKENTSEADSPSEILKHASIAVGEVQAVIAAQRKRLIDLPAPLSPMSQSLKTDTFNNPSASTKSISSAYAKLLEKCESTFGDISTGFHDLDEITGGLRGGDLIVVAGVSSAGKTSLCLNIAAHVALHDRLTTLVFSLSSNKQIVTQRLICSEAALNSRDLRRGYLQDSDWHRLTNAVNNLFQSNIVIDDSPTLSVNEIALRAHQTSATEINLGLIVVDYLQLIRSSRASENRTQEIGSIVRELKALAQRENVPLLLVSQISRIPESRTDKRPLLSDLRDSGTIGEDADTVIFIHQPSSSTIKTPPGYGRTHEEFLGSMANPDPYEGIKELIFAKQRNGPMGTIRLAFQAEFTRFTNLDRQKY
ncbi:MAG TPA: replicative DNA helicase [Abditibacteriaceae bacterium]